MDNERIRTICMALPHVAETVNWGHRLVYWAGDRDIGGKMFAMTDLDGTGFGVLWFHCGAERFHELLEIEGISAVALPGQSALGDGGALGRAAARASRGGAARAHALIFEKLPKRTRTVLAMPERKGSGAKAIRERKKVLAERAKAKRPE